VLAGALEAFSGDVAADERSEGPSCVLSAGDNRQDTRRRSAVLDPAPPQDDITAFVRRFKTALEDRGLARKGITTAGSARSPAPIRDVCGEGPHQLGPFHGIAALGKGGLRAVAAERQRLAAAQPTLPRGRPSSTEQAARRLARTRNARQEHIRAVFEGRFLGVTRRLTPSARHRLLRSTRGLPPLRTRREIMAHLSALCDRRGWTQTALGTLRTRRHWVQRFRWRGDTVTKVFAPHREPALTCLDDTLLPATSNAGERGHRRPRQRQKSVYRIRRKVC
jgi:hypothetical protein